MKLYQYYKELPPAAKGIIGVTVIAGMVFIGYKIFRKLNPTAEEKKNILLFNDIDSEISALKKKGVKPSFSESNYKTFADTCWEGMKYCVGDDYGAVEDTLKKMRNDLDVLELQKAYGSRQLYCFGIPVGEPKELFQAVKTELGSEYGGITGYRVTSINADWKKKGITYQI